MKEISVSVEQKNGMIGFNFEEIKNKLEAEMSIYKGMVFTEDYKKDAKETVASLRKLKKSVEDKRKEVKNSYMLPYTEFENKVKELNRLIDEPINFINLQVEAFEQKRLEEKRALIRQIYADSIGDMKEYLPLEKIYDSRWENATTSQKSIANDISEHIVSARSDLENIRSMASSYENKGIEVYKRTLSLNEAIQSIRSYEKQEAEIKARQEAGKQRSEERQKEESVQEVPAMEISKEFVDTKPLEENLTGIVTYQIVADRFQIAQLEAAMRDFGIEYTRLK